MANLDTNSANRTLMRELLGGNTAAFDLLLVRHQPSILHYALGFVQDKQAAEAVARRVFQRGFRQLARLRRNSLFSSFLIGILRKELGAMGLSSAPPGVSPLWAGLAGLPRVQREVVFLYFQGMPLRQVAHIRHEAPSHTRSRFSKALCHVARKSGHGGSRRELPAGCIRQDHVYIWLAGALDASEREALAGHVARCEACAQRHREGEELFARLREDIGAVTDVPPVLTQVPGPSLLSTLLGPAAILALAILGFFLLRAAFDGEVTTLEELPAGEVREVEQPPERP